MNIISEQRETLQGIVDLISVERNRMNKDELLSMIARIAKSGLADLEEFEELTAAPEAGQEPWTKGPWRASLDNETNEFYVIDPEDQTLALITGGRLRHFAANAAVMAQAPQIALALYAIRGMFRSIEHGNLIRVLALAQTVVNMQCASLDAALREAGDARVSA